MLANILIQTAQDFIECRFDEARALLNSESITGPRLEDAIMFLREAEQYVRFVDAIKNGKHYDVNILRDIVEFRMDMDSEEQGCNQSGPAV